MINIILSLLARVAIPISRGIMYIFFGASSAVAWLMQFLRADNLPEPTKMVVKIFFWGALIALPVFGAELGLSTLFQQIDIPAPWNAVIYWFLAIALVEEFFKYLVIRAKVINAPEFDEPVDAIVYMTTAALGFAALENILYLIPQGDKVFTFNQILANTVSISFFRFIGATFLHALCSGLVGFFLAKSIYINRKTGLTFLGLIIAVFLHGLYNFSIMNMAMPLKIAIPIIILFSLTIFIIFAFKNLKKMKSIGIV